MNKLAALLASLLMALGFNLATAGPAEAGYPNEVWHSRWSGTHGPIVITCDGGAVHWIHYETSSKPYCWDVWQIGSTVENGVMCYIAGNWVQRPTGTFIMPDGYNAYRNCRSYAT